MNKIKNLFSTPKKAFLSSLCVLLILILLGAGSVSVVGAIAKSSAIGEENAKNFAFADAGVDPAAAQNVRSKFDFEQGHFVYEVEFIANGTEYEYWIRASDGAVVKKESELVTQTPQGSGTTEQVTLEQAKEIALKDSGLQADAVTFTKAKLDFENGASVYDIAFYAGDAAYDYEINAATGAVYSKSKESLPPQQNQTGGQSSTVQSGTSSGQNTSVPQNAGQQNSASGQIGLEDAKSKALADAGLTASGVTFTTAKLDYDDGIAKYEIDFVTSTHKYDYEINASSGAIISKEVEAIGGNQNFNGNPGDEASYIGIDKAKSIAVGHAGFSVSDVVFSKAKLERDDGYVVYEVEFYKDGMEYEYTVHASTGDILQYDTDRMD